jgi:hypothetical protein
MTDVSKTTPQAKLEATVHTAFSWMRAHPLIWSGALFTIALIAYIAFQAAIIPSLGLWLDELFTLWAADPRIPFPEAFATRILPDTNGPIYFSLVHVMQQAGVMERAAFVVINFVAMAVLLGVILVRGWRSGLMATALSCVAIALSTAPLLVYGPEGRIYAMVMSLCAALAFEGGRALSGWAVKRNDLIIAGVMGAFSAWMHVYGAIFAGALAAALVITGWLLLRRRDVLVLGLVIGTAATAALVIWLAFAFRLFTGTIDWIRFDAQWVFDSIWTVKLYLIGPMVGVLVALAFIGLSLIPKHSRSLAIALIITGAIFVAIPLAVSVKMPIFLGRYLLVAGPALLVLCVFLLRLHVVADGAPRYWRGGLVALGVLFLAFPLMQGYPTASHVFATRSDWGGHKVALKAVGNCPEGEIRTLTSVPLMHGFDYYLEGRLKPVPPSAAPVRDVSDINCPVLGWAEHYENTDLHVHWYERADMARVLNDFRLTNTTGIPLEIVRHRAGLVLVRAEADLH